MSNKITSVRRRMLSFNLVAILALAISAVTLTACRSATNDPVNDVVVNSPADGVIRRVLVSEGAAVDKDAAIIEIAVETKNVSGSQTTGANAEHARALRNAQADLASAEGDATRTNQELKRIEPLVGRGLASKAEMDKARSQSQDAQERVRLARERVKAAEDILKKPAEPALKEELIAVRVPAAGTVRALRVQAGASVKTGQPLATINAKS